MLNNILKLFSILMLVNLLACQDFSLFMPPAIADYTTFDSKYVCKGEQDNIVAPKDYTLFLVDTFYGVTEDHTCQSINPQNCKQKFDFVCESTNSCTLSLFNNITLTDCGNRIADYIQIRYRFIPMWITDQDPNDICGDIDLKYPGGIVINSNYPYTNDPGSNCTKLISTAPWSYLSYRIYVADLNMDPPDNQECKSGYLELKSECDSVRFCGNRTLNRSFVFETCSNYLKITYVSTSTIQSLKGFSLYYEAIIKDNVNEVTEYSQSSCPSTGVWLACYPTTSALMSIFLNSQYYGTGPQDSCQYQKNDCTQTTALDPYVYSKDIYLQIVDENVALTECNNSYAKYANFSYKCVPRQSSLIDQYNICDQTLKNITNSEGFITSPNYPTYTMATDQCTQWIVAPANKKINIWFIDISLKDEDDCLDNYVRVTDSVGTYSYCGQKVMSLENKTCSSEIYLTYKAPFNLTNATYNGFKLYYKFADRDPRNDYDNSGIPLAIVSASDEKVAILCRNEEIRIGTPNGYSLFPIELVYGVTENGSCSNINPQNCIAPMNFTCPMQGNCSISLKNNVKLDQCGNLLASYIKFRYRFLPMTSTSNQSICNNKGIDGAVKPFGIITSPNYPNWNPNVTCETNIFASKEKVIRVFINDLSIESPNNDGKCDNGFLQLKSECESVVYCGDKTSNGSFIFTSCSNTLTISYVATTYNLKLKGFNLYYDVINEERSNDVNTIDVCDGLYFTSKCTKTYTTYFTSIVTDAFYGIHNDTSENVCKYKEGDCQQVKKVWDLHIISKSDLDFCLIFGQFDNVQLDQCEYRQADYLHVSYRCVPAKSTIIPSYNMCDNTLKAITTPKGFISITDQTDTIRANGCTQKIVAPNDKRIKIWFVYINIGQVPEYCFDGKIILIDGSRNYSVCGLSKLSFENLCSSIIYIEAPDSNKTPFTLYYEFVDREPNFKCTVPTMTSLSTQIMTQSTSMTEKTTTNIVETTTDYTMPTFNIFTISLLSSLDIEIATIPNETTTKHVTISVCVLLVGIVCVAVFFALRRGKKNSNKNVEFSKKKGVKVTESIVNLNYN